MSTIELTPNYQAMFTRFNDCAIAELRHLARLKNPTRSQVYAFISVFRVALGCATSEAEIVKLREGLDAGANEMFEKVQEDQE